MQLSCLSETVLGLDAKYIHMKMKYLSRSNY